MKTINVELGDRSYPIYIGQKLLSDKSIIKKHVTSKQVLIITNEVIAPYYLDLLLSNLSDKQVETLILPDGEKTKSLEHLNIIISRLLKNKFSRTCTLIALGGGVVGDLTGFAAACYQRGVKFIQVPTTLLAQVDSSVGGKTAVNHPLGKNMIGAFYQPISVIADTSVISTLPGRELSAGLAEVIKYGLIRDKKFFEWLQKNISKLINRDEAALAYAIERSCINKAEVVAEDETESGVRAILNLGHTFGHAIETALEYKEWLHGEAIGCGLLMAADLSYRLGYLNEATVATIESILMEAGLPVKNHPRVTMQKMLENMKVDKKAKDGVLYFILLESIGKAVITADIKTEMLEETINKYLSRG